MSKFRRRPARTASPVLRELFDILNDDPRSDVKIGKIVGVHPNVLSCWRGGQRSPTLINFENTAQTLGYRLTLTPIEGEER